MIEKIHLLFNKINTYSNFTGFSNSVKVLLELEEKNGAKILNRFRYFLTFILLLVGLEGSAGVSSYIIANLIFTFIYLSITILHSFILKRNSKKIIHMFDYISLILDNVLFLGLILYYWQLLSPDNFAFVLKNPMILIFLIPIVMSGIQFRVKLVQTAFLLFLIIFVSIVSYGIYTDIPTTLDWKEYVLGASVLMPAYLVIYFFTFLIIASIVWYSIYRAINMINRIGIAESQKASLSRYFSPNVVDEITNNPEVIETGRKQKVTILFSDIRDFTSMSESLSSEEIIELLNSIRAIQVESVFKHSGTVDKFIGDALMATFGTPNPSPIIGQDSKNAVQCGIEMIKRIRELNALRKIKNLQDIRVGIGIHTGEAFTGNIGTSDRLEYTVIGDCVNTASRIESLCKDFHSEFLISDIVYAEVGENINVEKMPEAHVKGKDAPIQVYSISV